jgi:hypothetical protein
VEKPFIIYQAAIALQRAAQGLSREEAAVRQAIAEARSLMRPDRDGESHNRILDGAEAILRARPGQELSEEGPRL